MSICLSVYSLNINEIVLNIITWYSFIYYKFVCVFCISEVEDDFDWGAYLMEGIERYEPSDEELSVSLLYVAEVFLFLAHRDKKIKTLKFLPQQFQMY